MIERNFLSCWKFITTAFITNLAFDSDHLTPKQFLQCYRQCFTSTVNVHFVRQILCPSLSILVYKPPRTESQQANSKPRNFTFKKITTLVIKIGVCRGSRGTRFRKAGEKVRTHTKKVPITNSILASHVRGVFIQEDRRKNYPSH